MSNIPLGGPPPEEGLQFQTGAASFPGDENGNMQAMQILIQGTVFHQNLHQEIIQISASDARHVLRDFLEAVSGKDRWLAAVGIFLSLLITLGTTDPKDTLGLTKEQMKAVFVISTICCAIWLAIELVLRFYNAKKASVQWALDRLKGVPED